MTKQYETLMQGSAAELLALATPPKGEFVGIIESGEEMTQQFQHQQVMQILLQELSPAKAARLGAQICGVNKKELYELAMSMNPQPQKNNCTRMVCRLVSGRDRSTLSGESQLGNRRSFTTGGKSGLHRAGCQVTPGGREPTESAAESRPPMCVKAVGKGERVR